MRVGIQSASRHNSDFMSIRKSLPEQVLYGGSPILRSCGANLHERAVRDEYPSNRNVVDISY